MSTEDYFKKREMAYRNNPNFKEEDILKAHTFKPIRCGKSRLKLGCFLCGEVYDRYVFEVERDDGEAMDVCHKCLKKVRLTLEDFGHKPRKSPWGESSKPKPKSEKARHPCYEDIVTGHKFELVGNYYMPEDEYTWCAFCGGRLKKAIEIKRDDGKKYKVGKTCIGNIGLVAPENLKEKMNPDSKAEEEKKSDSDISAEEIYELLKDI